MSYDNLPNYILLIILFLGSARASVSIVNDDIFKSLRMLVWKHSSPTPFMRDGSVEHKAGWWGQVINCPDCLGPYVAAFMMAGLHFDKQAFTLILLVLSVSMVTSLIARKY